MQRKVDALHAEIARLVAVEKAWHDKNSDENNFQRSFSHTRIEVAAWEPKLRKEGGKYATLTYPSAGRKTP